MRRGVIAVSSILCASLLLGGCASVPKLSEEENELVSEYAVSLLLKYDSQNHSRLVDVDEYVTTYEAAVAAREESIRAYEEEQARLEEEKIEQDQKTEEDKKTNDSNGGAEIINPETPQVSFADILCVPDFDIRFTDYKVTSGYKSAYASSGKKLIVLFFDITSPNGGTLDGFNNVESIQVSFNGDKYISSTFTSLDQDLAQCIESFSSGETKTFVVIAEVGKDFSVSKIKMKMTNIYNESTEATLVQ